MTFADAERISFSTVRDLVSHHRRGYVPTFVARTTLARDLPAWRIDAGRNRPAGLLMVGLCNYYGLGGQTDATRGRAMIAAAAKSGYAEAMAVYSIILRNGTMEVRPDVNEANRWLRQALAGGSEIARDEVALAAGRELLVADKTDEAIAAYRTGEKAGSLGCRVALAGILRRAWLMHDDIPASIKMLESAAGDGHIGAMLDLGNIYGAGFYVPWDPVRARQWFEQATATGDPYALGAAAHAYERGLLNQNGQPELKQANLLWSELAAQVDPYSSYAFYRYSEQDLYDPITVITARRKLFDAAARGNADAYLSVGASYMTGLFGLTKDPKTAVRYYEDGVAAGSANALFQRACSYRYGYSAPADEVKARADYFAAARLGVPRAMTSVGLRYTTGRGVPLDRHLGHLCFVAAAREGDADAMANVADDLERGLGTPANLEGARRWAQLAVANGQPDAYRTLAELEGGEDAIFRHVRLPKRAIEMYELGIRAGSVECMTIRGDDLIRGEYVSQDVKRGVALLEQASATEEKGRARFSLGYHYLNGTFLPQDTQKGRSYLQAAADRGNDDAWFELGKMYQKGIGVTKNVPEMVRCYEKAIALGNDDASNTLGMLNLYGDLFPKNVERGLQLIRQAAEHGHGQACANMASCELLGVEGRPVHELEGVAWEERGLAAGNGRAGWMAGHYFQAQKDYARALNYYNRAYALNDMASCNDVGVLYRFGLGVPQDFFEAAAHYRRAAEGNIPDAMSNYGWCLENGKGVPVDVQEAFRYQLKAAMAGLPEGMYHAGRMYFDGIGIAKDETLGADWLVKSANAGFPQAKAIVEVMKSKGLIH